MLGTPSKCGETLKTLFDTCFVFVTLIRAARRPVRRLTFRQDLASRSLKRAAR